MFAKYLGIKRGAEFPALLGIGFPGNLFSPAHARPHLQEDVVDERFGHRGGACLRSEESQRDRRLHGDEARVENCYLTNENIEYCDRFSHLQLYSQPEATHLRAKLAFLKKNRFNLYANDR
jgi:hypothetical protein